MKRTRPLDYLMPKLRQEVLAVMLLRPDRRWYLRELAQHLSVTPSSLQGELVNLVAAGVLTRTDSGQRAYFQADQSSPLFLDLQALIRKSIGITEILRAALQGLKGDVEVAFIYGSFARSEPLRNSSDVDLMIVGDVKGLELAEVLQTVESQIDRPVNPSVYSRKEFRDKLQAGNHFLSEVMRNEKLLVIGDFGDLERAA